MEGKSMFKTRPYKLADLRDWNIRMSREGTPELFDPIVSHVLRAQGFVPDSKVYHEPRSVYSCEKLWEQLANFDPAKSVYVDMDVHVQRGVAFAYKAFARNQKSYLTPLPLWDESIISNMDGSAGLTAYGLTKREAFSRGLLSAQRVLGNVPGRNRIPEPCIALTRTGKNGKSRLVWGYPMSMTIIEGTIARPLLEEFKYSRTPMMFGRPSKAIGARMLAASQEKKYFYSMDATQFDASVPKALIQVAFNILRSWFRLEDQFDENNTVGDVMDVIERYFIHTPIVMPTGNMNVKGDGILITGKCHGVPSGSYFTQLLDSIVNVIVLGTLASKFGFYVGIEEAFVLGDDLLFFTNSHLDMSELANDAKRTFGILFHGPEKSAHGRSFEKIPFLGRDWVRGIPTRETVKAIKKMCYPENYRKYGSDKKREGVLVALSYNLSAVQDVQLIPNYTGWLVGLPANQFKTQTQKVSGYMRYQMKHSKVSSAGAVNLLSVLNM